MAETINLYHKVGEHLQEMEERGIINVVGAVTILREGRNFPDERSYFFVAPVGGVDLDHPGGFKAVMRELKSADKKPFITSVPDRWINTPVEGYTTVDVFTFPSAGYMEYSAGQFVHVIFYPNTPFSYQIAVYRAGVLKGDERNPNMDFLTHAITKQQWGHWQSNRSLLLALPAPTLNFSKG